MGGYIPNSLRGSFLDGQTEMLFKAFCDESFYFSYFYIPN